MKLDEEERQVIACMCFDADMPLREVARKTTLREHVVRRCLDKVLNNNVVKYRLFVNPYAAGLCEYMILIGTQLMQPPARQLLLNTLMESPHTTYIGTVGGDYHLAVMIVARELREVTTFVDTLCASVKGAAFEISIAICVSVTLFRPKFLGVDQVGASHISYGPIENVAALDALDHKVLHAFGASPGSSISQLSKTLGVPVSTTTYRLESLREKGVLLGRGLSVVPYNDGYFAFALEVRAGSMPKEVRDAFRQFCGKHPSISYLIEAIGAWNFQIGVRLEDPRSVTVVADDIQRRFAPYVFRITVIPIHEALKLFPHPFMSTWAHAENRQVA